MSKHSTPPHSNAPIPSASGDLKDQCRNLKGQLSSHAFEGDAKSFKEAFNRHLEEWGHKDPHARYSMNQIILGSGLSPLAFRCLSVDREEVRQYTRKRWLMWLDALPLDTQLAFLHFEMDMRDVGAIPFESLDWETLRRIEKSKDPETEFRLSNIGGWVDASHPGPGSSPIKMDGENPERRAKNWLQARQTIQENARFIASAWMAWGEWDVLDEWMTQAGIHPWERMDEVYVHHVSPNSRGSHCASLPGGLPFWCSGLCSGASDPRFWEVMGRHGGPSHPGITKPVNIEQVEATLTLSGKRVGDAGNLDLAQPHENFVRGDYAMADEALSQMSKTAAAWRQMSMEHSFPRSAPPRVRATRL